MQLQKMSPHTGPQHLLPCTASAGSARKQLPRHGTAGAKPGQEQPGTPRPAEQGTRVWVQTDPAWQGRAVVEGRDHLAYPKLPTGIPGDGVWSREWLGGCSDVGGPDAFIIQVEGERLLLELLRLRAVPQARARRGPALALRERRHEHRVPERGWQPPQRRPLPLGLWHRRPGLPGARGGRLARGSPLLRRWPWLRGARGTPGPGHRGGSHKGHLLQGQGRAILVRQSTK